jgi:hypothetical protein
VGAWEYKGECVVRYENSKGVTTVLNRFENLGLLKVLDHLRARLLRQGVSTMAFRTEQKKKKTHVG